MKKSAYLILLISFLYQTFNHSMDNKQTIKNKQIKSISNPQSFAWVDDKTIAITNQEGCYLIDSQRDIKVFTLRTDPVCILKSFDNNQKILLSEICLTDNMRQLTIYDLKTKEEIVPRLSKNCFLCFTLADQLIFTSSTFNQREIIDTNNKQYNLPLNNTIRPVAGNVNSELLCTPVHTDIRPTTPQNWTLVNLKSLDKPEIKIITPTFLKDPKNVSTAFYSSDGTCVAFNTTPYINDNRLNQWYIYNFITDTLINPVNCKTLAISQNNTIVAYLSHTEGIIYLDIKLNQIICTFPFPIKDDWISIKLSFSPNGQQLAILENNQLSLYDVPVKALNPPSISAICTRLLLLKFSQYNQLPKELVWLIIKKLALSFGYSV